MRLARACFRSVTAPISRTHSIAFYPNMTSTSELTPQTSVPNVRIGSKRRNSIGSTGWLEQSQQRLREGTYASNVRDLFAATLCVVSSKVKNGLDLSSQGKTYRGSKDFGIHLAPVNQTVLEVYKLDEYYASAEPMEVIGPKIDALFCAECITNLAIEGGILRVETIKYIGMTPGQLGELTITAIDDYVVDFVYNVLQLGLATEDRLATFLRQKEDGRLLNMAEVDRLLLHGEHLEFDDDTYKAVTSVIAKMHRVMRRLLCRAIA